MAVVHGSDAYFTLDNSGGTPVDLSTYCQKASFELSYDIHDTTVFSNNSHQKVPGLKDGKFTITFFHDPTLLTHLTGLYSNQAIGTTWSFVFGPRGSTSGYAKFSGECLMPGIPIDADVSNVETITVAFEVTGDVTIGTF